MHIPGIEDLKRNGRPTLDLKHHSPTKVNGWVVLVCILQVLPLGGGVYCHYYCSRALTIQRVHSTTATRTVIILQTFNTRSIRLLSTLKCSPLVPNDSNSLSSLLNFTSHTSQQRSVSHSASADTGGMGEAKAQAEPAKGAGRTNKRIGSIGVGFGSVGFGFGHLYFNPNSIPTLALPSPYPHPTLV